MPLQVYRPAGRPAGRLAHLGQVVSKAVKTRGERGGWQAVTSHGAFTQA